MNYFNTIVKNMANPNSQQEMKAQIKKRDTFINKLQDKLKTITQEKQFVNKSYQELQKKYELLNNQSSNEQILFKKNVQIFLKNLQNIPQQIIDLVISSLLQKFGQILGQEFDINEIKSVLQLDFNYKAVFTDYISKIFQLTKQTIRETELSKKQLSGLQIKLEMKDKEIQEIVERYEVHIEQLKKQVDGKLANKMEEYNIVKEQKDNMIRDLSNNLKLKVQENEDIKVAINKIKTNQNQMRVQKQKIQQKLFEQCQISKELQNKKNELDGELKTIKQANEKLFNQVIEQKNGLIMEIAYLKEQCKKLEIEVAQEKEINLKLKKNYSQRRLTILKKISKCQVNDVKENLLRIKQDINRFNQTSDQEHYQSQFQQALQKYYSLTKNRQVIKQGNQIQENIKQVYRPQIIVREGNNSQFKQSVSVGQNQPKVDLESKVKLLQENNKEVADLLIQKDNQVKQLSDKIQQLMKRMEQQKEKSKQLQQKYAQKEKINNNLGQQIDKLKLLLTEINIQFQKSKQEINQKKEFTLKQQTVIKQYQARVSEIQILNNQKIAIKQSQICHLLEEMNRAKMGLEQTEQRYDHSSIYLSEQVQKNQELTLRILEMIQSNQNLKKQFESSEQENQKLSTQTQLLNKELRQSKSRIEMFQKQLSVINQEKHELTGKLEEKNISLQKLEEQKIQIQRLMNTQLEQLSDYQIIKQKVDNLEFSLNQGKKELEQSFKTIQQKQKQINLLKATLSQKQAENVSYNNSQREKHENQKRKWMQESEQLKQEKIKKDNQINELKSSISMFQEKINILNQSLNNKQGESGNSIQMLADLQLRYKDQSHQKSQKINSLQSNCRQLSHQLQESDVIKKNQSDTINDLNNQIMQKNNIIKDNQNKIKELNSQLQQQKKNIEQLKYNEQKIKSELVEWKQKHQQLYANFSKYLVQLQQLKTSKLQQINKNSAIKQQLRASVKKCEEKQSQIIFLQGKISELQQERTHLKSIEAQFQKTVFQTADEMRTLELKQLRESDQFIREREQYSKKQKQFVQIINSNQGKLVKLDKQIEEDKMKISSLESEIEQLKVNISLMQEQNNKQKFQFNEIRKQLEQANTRFDEKEKKYNEINQIYQDLLRQNNNLNNKIEEVTKQLENAETTKRQIQVSLFQYKDRLQKTETVNASEKEMIVKKANEWQSDKIQFQRVIDQKNNKIDSLNQLVKEKQQEIKTLKELMTANINEKERLQFGIELINKQLDSLRQQEKLNYNHYKDQELEMIHLKQSIQQLQKSREQMSEKLTIQSQQLQKITQRLSLKQADNKEIQSRLQHALADQKQKCIRYQQQINDVTAKLRRQLEAKDCRISDQMYKNESLHTAKRQLQTMNQTLSQRMIIMQGQIDQKVSIISEKQRIITKMSDDNKNLSENLKKQTELKNQAIQDQQLMSQFYKDFQSRQAELTARNQSIKQLEQLQNDFASIFFKDFNKESMIFVKSSIDMLNEQIRYLKQSNSDIVKSKKEEIDKLKQDILQNSKMSQHFQSKYIEQQNMKIKLETQLKQKILENQTLGKDYKSKEIDLLNQMNKLQSGMQKLKMEIQQYKNKLSKKQSEVSKYMENINALESKAAFLKTAFSEKEGEVNGKQTTINNLRKEIQTLKQKMNAEIKSKVLEKELLQKENQKIRSQIEKVNIDGALQIKKQLLAREEQFKLQKQAIESKSNQQNKRIRDQIDNIRKEKQQLQRSLNTVKINIIQQKKINARLQAQLQEARSDITKFDSLKNSNVQIQQKMTLKDEQIKKCFANINSLKITISELEEGIQTYQSMAEQKQKQVQIVNQTIQQFKEENDRLKNDIERLQRKLRDSRVQTRAQHMMAQQVSPVRTKKEESILALKLLFLKYFEPASTYQTKLRTFDTLCEVLSLNSKQNQLMNQYKRTRLSKQAMNDHKQKGKGSFENKFLDFLSSDQ